MVRKGFVHAATLAALIAMSLATEKNVAIAHHGWSEYNSQQTLNLTGEILQVSYDHPHTIIALKTENKTWKSVLAPPSRMERRGLPANALKVGQTVRVVGYPHRSDTSEMRAERIIIGKQTIELR